MAVGTIVGIIILVIILYLVLSWWSNSYVYLSGLNSGKKEIKIPAKKGLTLIWPSDWTHTHKGEISKTKEKFIVTGWLSFLKE